ncbi:type II toxin-antitoxin system VapC family toxin [Azotobacter vinelandii]|uniref:type II toxin-antitoxin system VapC family toxin n=1 Tax=Azotobacter vinelandii TaxID=354 RepID=UPI000773CE1F|nr:type II toxin-antitoxin system VapC family toxin [Azotobacter vinelandii]WKN20299.1 type II toxin-antitoxin system VapC family toxin [Azotobacter vinelandii]
MRLLIDTHILLWILIDDSRLTPKARKLLGKASEIYISTASFWEMAIKQNLGKLDLQLEQVIEECQNLGIQELPVSAEHILALLGLEPLHKDPFDRLLVAVAKAEPMKLLTADSKVAAYTELAVLI